METGMSVADTLPNDIPELKAIIRAQQDQNARLEALVQRSTGASLQAASDEPQIAAQAFGTRGSDCRYVGAWRIWFFSSISDHVTVGW